MEENTPHLPRGEGGASAQAAPGSELLPCCSTQGLALTLSLSRGP